MSFLLMLGGKRSRVVDQTPLAQGLHTPFLERSAMRWAGGAGVSGCSHGVRFGPEGAEAPGWVECPLCPNCPRERTDRFRPVSASRAVAGKDYLGRKQISCQRDETVSGGYQAGRQPVSGSGPRRASAGTSARSSHRHAGDPACSAPPGWWTQPMAAEQARKSGGSAGRSRRISTQFSRSPTESQARLYVYFAVRNL